MKQFLTKLTVCLAILVGQSMLAMDLNPNPRRNIKEQAMVSVTAEPTQMQKGYIPKAMQALVAQFMMAPVLKYLEQHFAPMHKIDAHRVQSVAVSPDGSRIVTGEEGIQARVWDVNTGRLLRTLFTEDNGEAFGTIVYNHDGSQIAVATPRNPISIFDVNTGEEFLIDDFPVNAVSASFSPNNSKLAVAFNDDDEDDDPVVFQLPEGNSDLFNNDPNIDSLLFSPDGSKIVACGNRTQVFSVVGDNYTELYSLNFNADSVAFSNDSSLLVMSTLVANSPAKILNVKTGQVIPNIDLGYGNWVAFGGNNIIAVASRNQHQIKIFELQQTTNGYKAILLQVLPYRGYCTMAFSSDGSTLAVKNKIYRQLITPEQRKQLLNWLKYNIRIEEAKVLRKIYNAKSNGRTDVILSVNELFDLTRFMPDNIREVLIKAFGVQLRRSPRMQQLIAKNHQLERKMATINGAFEIYTKSLQTRDSTFKEKKFLHETLGVKPPQRRKRKRKDASGESSAKRVKVQETSEQNVESMQE